MVTEKQCTSYSPILLSVLPQNSYANSDYKKTSLQGLRIPLKPKNNPKTRTATKTQHKTISPTQSLQISSFSSSFSHATFSDTTGQLYVQVFYKTTATSADYGGIKANWKNRLAQHIPASAFRWANSRLG